jgi:hypothetical protein
LLTILAGDEVDQLQWKPMWTLAGQMWNIFRGKFRKTNKLNCIKSCWKTVNFAVFEGPNPNEMLLGDDVGLGSRCR